MKKFQIKIKEPWWGAYKRFGWDNKVWGVGLNKKDVDVAAIHGIDLEVHVWKFKIKYLISAKEVIDYSTEHKTIFTARAGTKLYVIPSTLLKENQNGYQQTLIP